MTDSGYTVKFAATKKVLDDGAGTPVSENATGLLRKASMIAGTTFKYTITISKAGQEDVTSGVPANVTVKTMDKTKITAITEVALVDTADGTVNNDDKLWENKFITVDYNTGNHSVAVVPTKGTNAFGKVIEPAATKTNLTGLVDPSAVVTYESDKPLVAFVNAATGVVTPVAEGMTTITVKVNGKVAATVPVTVKEKQTPTALKEKMKTIPKQSVTQDVELIVVDEDGKDLLKGSGTYKAEAVGANKADITVNEAVVYDSKAKLTVTVPKAAKAGTYTVNIKLNDKMLDTLTLTVAALPSEADKYEILKASDESIVTENIKFDLKEGGVHTLELKYQGYDSVSGLAVTSPTPLNGAGFTLVSSDKDIVKINADHKTIEAVGVGTAQVKLVQLGYVWDTVTVEVTNTTPKITKIALKEGKDKIEVDGDKLANASVIKDIFDELEVTFDDATVKLHMAGSDLSLKEITSMVESNGNVHTFAELGNATAATAVTKAVVGNVEGVLIIKVSDLYGGESYSFPVVVLDKTAPTVTPLTGKKVAMNSTSTVVFSEKINADSQKAVQDEIKARVQGANAAQLEFAWSVDGLTLTVKNNNTSTDATFAAPVTVDIADLVGNTTTNALIVQNP